MQRLPAWPVLLAVLLVLPGCGSAPKDLVVGKWQSADGKGDTVEFTREGQVTFVTGERTVGGSYKNLKGSVFEITWGSAQPTDTGFKAEKSVQSVDVTKDELTVSDPGGQRRKYKRVP